MSNPCLDCGACCASYRVSFYWAETESARLAPHLTERLTLFLACMVGTSQAQPRCKALQGKIGVEVACTVYLDRPSPCRELAPGDEQCLRARTRHGLPKLEAGESPTVEAP